MTMETPGRQLDRRQFLRWAGAAGAVAAPTLLGYGMLRAAEGEHPTSGSPYAEDGRPRQPSPLSTDSPLLVLLNEKATNPFGPYLSEILRAEGLNCFQVANVSEVDNSTLAQFQLVLLGEGPLSNTEADLLGGYIARGGRLVAMRPDARLSSLLGLEFVTGTTAEGYLWANTDDPAIAGMETGALQFHGEADHYRLSGARAVAWLGADANTPTEYPAVTLYRYEKGQAIAWAFDLAQSIVLMRQGNPAWANQERDGQEGIRPHDAFVGWVDLDRIELPQADEQMRLLSRLIDESLAEALPLPRLWYFPGEADGLVIATGDSHQNPAVAIEQVLVRVEEHGGHMSIYYSPPLSSNWRRAGRKARRWVEGLPVIGRVLDSSDSPPTPRHITEWRARGHEFGIHPYVEEGLQVGWRRHWQEFTGLGYGPVSPTVRTHRVLWTGWVESAVVQAGYGLGMNMDYYHIGPAFRRQDGEWVYGHFTGSGLPMRFIDQQGRILSIYQQLTQLVDEHLLSVPWGGHVKLRPEEAIEVSRQLLDRSQAGGYSAIGAQFHIDPFAVGGEYAADATLWLEGTLDHAAAQGFPIWSAAEWLRFTEIRHETMIQQIRWDPAASRLSFRLVAEAAPEAELTVMMPLWHGKARLAGAELDGQTAKVRERRLNGSSFGSVVMTADSHQVVATYV